MLTYLRPLLVATVLAAALSACEDQGTGIDAGSGASGLTGRAPIGYLGRVELDGTVTGWACDLDAPKSSIEVHIYVGGPAGSGAKGYPVTADHKSEDAVKTRCGGGSAHRFAFKIPGGVDGEQIYAYGIDVGPAPHRNVQLTKSPLRAPVKPIDPGPVSAGYPKRPSVGQIKAIQPDGLSPKQIFDAGGHAIALNAVWAHAEPKVVAGPNCPAGYELYDGRCFKPNPVHDAHVKQATALGMTVTAILHGVPQWARVANCNPLSPGFEWFCAARNPADFGRYAGFLAHRYNGKNGHGRVVDFVIHNEVNNNHWYDIGCGPNRVCNQTKWLDMYAGDFNHAYDAIVSEIPYARLFVSLDHFFGTTYDNPSRGRLSGATVLRGVDARVGNRRWRVAHHPYPPDLLSPVFGIDDWPRVTYGNIGTLLGWLRQNFPTKPWTWRDVHLTESGINSLTRSNEFAQGVWLCQSFEAVLGTPGIDQYIYHRAKDHPVETRDGLGVGLIASDGRHKWAWEVWRDANLPGTEKCGFENGKYTVLRRHFSLLRGHWTSTRPPPSNMAKEGSWRLRRKPTTDTRLLWECRVGGHNVISTDGSCEGLHPMGPVGYAFTKKKSGTVPLYRCHTPGDHFVSSDPGCEGKTTEGLLGYVYPN